MTDDTAAVELQALVKIPGALKIITNVRAGIAGVHADPRLPSSYVCHGVVSIEGPDDHGRYVAHSAEGDWAMGYPAALLARLRQWRNG